MAITEQAQATQPAAQAKLSPAAIKARKEAIELQKKNEDLLQELQEWKDKAAEPVPEKVLVAPVQPVADPNAEMISTLQVQVKLLSDQVALSQSMQMTGKPIYKPVPADDFQDEGVLFSCRKVFYVIGSYLDHKGMEVMPPYKLITLHYASSDRRKEGHEEAIVNSCTFTTHLKAEIEFLRNHPMYAVEFFESLNATMGASGVYNEFRVKAANQVIAMKDESVINTCYQKGVAHVDKMSIKDLRRSLTGVYAEEYIGEAKELQSDLERRRLVGHPATE
ncbi:hypothetical protein LCGC14_0278410 [marine sediment metagenome]|uniref:Uncharacterized protein n=1 Tax=marine sediment metagenome TaxID=412755 RepID=A0A0F9X249_9ZZZZ